MSEATTDERTTGADPVPDGAGLPAGGRPGSDRAGPRSGSDLIEASAGGEALDEQESDDLLAYYLSNDGLPGDEAVQPITVKLGHGAKAREFRAEVHPIEWAEWQDARERATDETSGEFDPYVSASWIVARALSKPKLGPTVQRLQREDEKNAPPDAAALLRRMFRKQSGSLLEISGKVLEISKLQNDNGSVKEVEAAKN